MPQMPSFTSLSKLIDLCMISRGGGESSYIGVLKPWRENLGDRQGMIFLKNFVHMRLNIQDNCHHSSQQIIQHRAVFDLKDHLYIWGLQLPISQIFDLFSP